MSIVSIFSGSFCASEEVAQSVAAELDWPLMRDADLVGRVSRQNGLSPENLRRAMYGRISIFNQFSHEKERAVAGLKLGLTELLEQDNLVFLGYASLLVLGHIRHVLNVCLIAETKYRVAKVAREMGLSPKEALHRVHHDDEAAYRWAEYLHDQEPWLSTMYDIRLPMDKTSQDEAVDLICQAALSPQLQPSKSSRQDLTDFGVTARVEMALAQAGHSPSSARVSTNRGEVTIQINKRVIMLERLAQELKQLAAPVKGLRKVSVEAGPDYFQADVYRWTDVKLPSKVLLVDDERELVQTLSQRLLLREIGSAMVHDGEEALRVVAEDEPEVMVLDLKMPGLHGKEVLRRIKTDYPQVEVIILTGHGSEYDRDECLQLGAFAYLEKPVDIERLSQAMQEAYEAVERRRG